jgi:hypothetical protein
MTGRTKYALCPFHVTRLVAMLSGVIQPTRLADRVVAERDGRRWWAPLATRNGTYIVYSDP